jgi:hypothetical protein
MSDEWKYSMSAVWKSIGGLIAFLSSVSLVQARIPPVDKPSPLFTGKKIPEPPQQEQPWRAPAGKVSANLVKLNRELFKLGFADPRGCEYRVITVTIGSVWTGDAGTFETHGWVLPATAKRPHRFAVCWNALVYPVNKIGPPVDLGADVKTAAKAARTNKPNYSEDEYPPSSEGWSIWHKNIGSHNPLLLRLGKVKLFMESHGEKSDKKWAINKALVGAGSHWAWTLFERGICAQMRGDDVVALHSYRLLAKARPLIEARIPRAKQKDDARQSRPLDFLSQFPALLADQERRVQKPRQYADVVCIGPGKHADPKKRIAALIERLDEVSARQDGQPGGVSMGSDPIVQALIREGEPALGPLLDCFEKDNRFTRSVHFWRDFDDSRTVLAVHEAAYSALTAILHTGGFKPAATGDNLTRRRERTRKQLANHFRKYKKKRGDVPLAERYFRVLADDKAKPAEWADAASVLMEREDVALAGGTMVWTGAVVRTRPPSDRLVGESLRKRKNPSLTELLVRRICQTKDAKTSATLALRLATWDGKAAVPILTSQMKKDTGARDPSRYVKMIDARLKAGDKSALDEYAVWLRGLRPAVLRRTWYGNIFLPLVDHGDHPKIAKSAAWLFNDPASPWVPLVGNKSGNSDDGVENFLVAAAVSKIFETSLVRNPEVREAFLRELAVKKQIGTVEYDKKGRRSYSLPDVTNSYETGIPWRDAHLPAEGVKGKIRVCDWVAYQISETWDGAPRCELWWPQEKRDKAVTACKFFLEKYGDRLGRDYQHMTFPVRTRPATEKEVQNGTAIFTLHGKVRALPWKFPIEARWTALKDNPFHVKEKKDGTTVTKLVYRNKGRVWQAEEAFEKGKWRRYYGFVGGHRIERVPAEEIEFPPPIHWSRPKDRWTQLAPGLYGRLRGWWKKDDLYEGGHPRRTTAEALPVVIELWNARGLNQPTPVIEKLLKLRVAYSPATISRQGVLVPAGVWRGLAARRAVAWKESPPMLEPGRTVSLAAVDLRAYFKLTEQGFYQVSLGTVNLCFSLGPENTGVEKK